MFTRADGQKYTGTWANDVPNGEGVLEWKGQRYEGTFSGGLRYIVFVVVLLFLGVYRIAFGLMYIYIYIYELLFRWFIHCECSVWWWVFGIFVCVCVLMCVFVCVVFVCVCVG